MILKIFKTLKIDKNFLFKGEESLSLNSQKCRSEIRKYLVKSGYEINLMKISTTPEGKPYFKSLPLNFSFSHSKEFSAFAVSYKKIGIDIEVDHPLKDYTKLAKRLNITDPDFLKEWTRREAILKLSGGDFPNLFKSPQGKFNLYFSKRNNLYIHSAEEL